MASEASKSRSPAAMQASRRNGARSRGPRTAAGKAVSARNACARQPVRAEDLPAWIKTIEANLTEALGTISRAAIVVSGRLEERGDRSPDHLLDLIAIEHVFTLAVNRVIGQNQVDEGATHDRMRLPDRRCQIIGAEFLPAQRQHFRQAGHQPVVHLFDQRPSNPTPQSLFGRGKSRIPGAGQGVQFYD